MYEVAILCRLPGCRLNLIQGDLLLGKHKILFHNCVLSNEMYEIKHLNKRI